MAQSTGLSKSYTLDSVQQQHFEARAHQARDLDRLPSSAADAFFFFGALVAGAAVFIPPGNSPDAFSSLVPWIRCATWMLFSSSAVLANG